MTADPLVRCVRFDPIHVSTRSHSELDLGRPGRTFVMYADHQRDGGVLVRRSRRYPGVAGRSAPDRFFDRRMSAPWLARLVDVSVDWAEISDRRRPHDPSPRPAIDWDEDRLEVVPRYRLRSTGR
jgi:hypothetical protein